jgi:hypothetical protein
MSRLIQQAKQIPLLAHFPIVRQLPLILHWFVGIPKQERTTNSCPTAQEHENTIYKRIHLNREISPFFCTVVDSLTASLSKAKLPTR